MLSFNIVYFYALALLALSACALALSACALPITLGKLNYKAKCLDSIDDSDL